MKFEGFSFVVQDDEVFLEAQVQNITSGAMVMESVTLEPAALYTITDLNCVTGYASNSDLFLSLSGLLCTLYMSLISSER